MHFIVLTRSSCCCRPLDRERQSEYSFVVVATDGGRYDARSQSVPVHITVTDVNDQRPEFTRFPFTATIPASSQPGQSVLRVSAVDRDVGTNAEVLYSFVPGPGTLPGLDPGAASKFRLDPSTGVVTVATALAVEAGRLVRLQVLARDKGNPPLSSTGLVEIRVSSGLSQGPADDATSLRFQNQSYVFQLEENAAAGTAVAQVSAVRSDSRLQRIAYRLDNERDTFEINPSTGLIRVRDPARLDHEQAASLRLVVVAEAEAEARTLYGYCEVTVQLQDSNDNPPRFTQDVYSAAVWEGKSKGTFVLRVAAVDVDSPRLLYHIVDGNHDNAFVISPATSGLVKTNIVLDREIRDSYRLKVIATDQGGSKQLTGTATIRISVVDVNDNRPTFPPHSVVSVSEGRELGTVLTAITANDVDTHPALTYSFLTHDTVAASDGPFAMDRFSGKVTLTRHLDYETRREYQLRVVSSDSAYTAVTQLTVKVTDENDNAPVFTQTSYEATLAGRHPSKNMCMSVELFTRSLFYFIFPRREQKINNSFLGGI